MGNDLALARAEPAAVKTWRSQARRFGADMRECCIRFRGSQTSGARAPARNRAVGGAKASKHRTDLGGLAQDITFATIHGCTLAQRWLRTKGYYVYVGPDYGKKRIHVQLVRAGVDPRTVLEGIPT